MSSQRRAITRNRELLACTECRRRKLKCDRGVPCSACGKRGDDTDCRYQRYGSGPSNERERRLQAESKLQHLEQLVQELAKPTATTENGQTTAVSAHSIQIHNGSSTASGNPSSQSLQANKPAYTGPTHWSAMLEDIEELRYAITSPDLAYDGVDDANEATNNGIELLFGAMAPLALQDVLALYLPSRRETDRLTALYFRSQAVTAPFIHAAQFRRLYQAFWSEPLKAPPLWTSILFSICHISESSLTLRKEMPSEDDQYSIAAAHCLAIGSYYKPQRFALEALVLYAQSMFLARLDVSSDVGILLGLVIRIATTMGYHRDPMLLQLSPFDMEMRRRVWSMCMQLDLLVAFQLGLPSNVQSPTWNTPPPHNLLSSDFDEDCLELPAARPDSEITDVLFYIAKHKLMAVFEKVVRHSLAVQADSSFNVESLDKEIRKTYAALPEALRARPMADSVVDPPYLIVIRTCVFFIHQKSLCVLHRRYAVQGRAHSVRTCYEAASDLVRYFNDIYGEFQRGGQLETERWFMGSLTWHDYLLAVMALCLVVCLSRQTSENGSGIDVVSSDALQLLHQSQVICADQSRRSKDTQRVRNLIHATLSRFGLQLDANMTQESVIETGSSWVQSNPSNCSDGYATTPSLIPDLDTYGESSTSGLANDEWGFNQNQDTTGPMDDPSWAYLEQFLNLSPEF